MFDSRPLVRASLWAGLLFLLPYQLVHERCPREEFVIWDVGQGLWTTWIRSTECWHFDMGGEFRHPFARILEVCGEGKLNRLFLSHWDWDHVGFVPYAKLLPWKLCIGTAPGGIAHGLKTQMLEGLPDCESSASREDWDDLWDVAKGDPPQKQNLKNRSNNHDSHVFELKRLGILVPGDSTVDEEGLWCRKLHSPIHGLVLGHHGSRTSTGETLLQALPHLRWAVASQRFRRFGHPHAEVVQRLRAHHVPLLKTEDWGNLHFQI